MSLGRTLLMPPFTGQNHDQSVLLGVSTTKIHATFDQKKVITWRPNPDSVASSYWTQTQKSREKIFNYRATKEQTSWKKWCFSDIMPFSTRRRLCPAPPIAVVVLESNPPFRAMPTPRTTTMAVILENDTASTTTMYFEGFYPSSAYTAEPVSRGCLIGRAWHDIG